MWHRACVVGVCVHGGVCGERGHAWWGGGMRGRQACMGGCVGGMHGRGHAWQGGMHGRGHAWQGGMHGRYYEIWSMSGGMHPTGMHSCYQFLVLK